MPPNDPPNLGADDTRTWSSGMLAAFRAEFSLDIDEVELAGDDWAFERGTYTIALTPKAGGTPIRDVEVDRNRGGRSARTVGQIAEPGMMACDVETLRNNT
jgi:hypothetical protein